MMELVKLIKKHLWLTSHPVHSLNIIWKLNFHEKQSRFPNFLSKLIFLPGIVDQLDIFVQKVDFL